MAKVMRHNQTLRDELIAFLRRVARLPHPENMIMSYTIKDDSSGISEITVCFIPDDEFLKEEHNYRNCPNPWECADHKSYVVGGGNESSEESNGASADLRKDDGGGTIPETYEIFTPDFNS